MKTKDFIKEYWGKTELGRRMLESEFVSDSDLLFLIPNNVKRRHGIPAARVAKRGRKAKKYKEQRRRKILSFKLWELISEIIEEIIPKTWNKEYFQSFVDIKDMPFGDQHIFFAENKAANYTKNYEIDRRLRDARDNLT